MSCFSLILATRPIRSTTTLVGLGKGYAMKGKNVQSDCGHWIVLLGLSNYLGVLGMVLNSPGNSFGSFGFLANAKCDRVL